MKQFMTIEEAAEQFSRSTQTIRRSVTEMKKHSDRYKPEHTFFGNGKVLIRTVALMDYERNKEYLANYPELATPYNPADIEFEFGIRDSKYPTAEEIAREVVAILRRK